MAQTTNQKTECQSTSRLSSWRLSWLRVFISTFLGEKLNQLAVRARLATLATLLAGRNNPRAFAGIVLIVAGPVVKYIYLAFDVAGGDPLSYWNAHFFLHAVRGDMSVILFATGFGLLIAERNKLRLFTLLPIAEGLGRIVWMTFVSNNTQFHAVMPWAFGLVGLAASVVWFMLFEWLMNLHFHKRAGHLARARGVLTLTDIDDEQKVTIALRELNAYEQLK